MLSISDATAVSESCAAWSEGRLVAFPTETVYGLGGDAENDRAVAAIFAAKGRPSFNPLILHLGDASWAKRYADVSPPAEKMMEHFWPGPLTLVLPRRADAPSSLLASAGLDTVALRVPGHVAARQLVSAYGKAIAAPSANRSGRISPTAAQHVVEEFAGRAEGPALILDGGPCVIGLESTVLDMTGDVPVILRPGGISFEMLREHVPDVRIANSSGKAILAPGMLASHYAPRLPVRLNISDVRGGEALLAFGSTSLHASPMLNLSMSGDLREAAANLFAFLRRLDDPATASAIAVMPIPEHGLGLAINDRLRRAAAPREP